MVVPAKKQRPPVIGDALAEEDYGSDPQIAQPLRIVHEVPSQQALRVIISCRYAANTHGTALSGSRWQVTPYRPSW